MDCLQSEAEAAYVASCVRVLPLAIIHFHNSYAFGFGDAITTAHNAVISCLRPCGVGLWS